MSIETEIAALTAANNSLLAAFNQQLVTVQAEITAAQIGAAALLDQQKTITGNYTLVAGDAIKTIFVDNAAGAVVVTVPAGLPARFMCAFIQMGTGNVSFAVTGGAVINSAFNMLKIKGQTYGVFIQQNTPTSAATNIYYMIGKTKA